MTYEYTCETCKEFYLLEQKITEEPIKKCQKCGEESAKRLISSASDFVLKGSGWYRDGY